ncbi:MAG: hypothetical protein R3Y28_03280 [Candidatus Gastranaerophilales bacterium]
MIKDLDYYINLNWTLIQGQDLDFEGHIYYYIEIKELPSFIFTAKTPELALANYKTQLGWALSVMIEKNAKIIEPEEFKEEIDWEKLCP